MRRIINLFLFLIVSLSIMGQDTSAAQQILAKAVSVITNAKGIETKFTIYNSGYSGTGEIVNLGNRFKVTMPDIEVWYNGKDMFTYNKRSQETTVVNPSAEELSESNPLAYVTEASKKYNVSFSTVKKSGKDVLELVPKTKGEIKRITLTLRKSDYVPEKIVVEPSKGEPVTAEIISFKTGAKITASDFEYPKSKYPKVEIVDLR